MANTAPGKHTLTVWVHGVVLALPVCGQVFSFHLQMNKRSRRFPPRSPAGPLGPAASPSRACRGLPSPALLPSPAARAGGSFPNEKGTSLASVTAVGVLTAPGHTGPSLAALLSPGHSEGHPAQTWVLYCVLCPQPEQQHPRPSPSRSWVCLPALPRALPSLGPHGTQWNFQSLRSLVPQKQALGRTPFSERQTPSKASDLNFPDTEFWLESQTLIRGVGGWGQLGLLSQPPSP